MLCASSRTVNCHFNLLKVFSSLTANWYEVITTWKLESCFEVNFFVEKFFLIIFLCFIPPQYGSILRPGQKRRNYCCQLWSVLVGEIIKNGPHLFFIYAIALSREMAWIVFPKPISSAKIPLIPCKLKLYNHFNPFVW